MAIGKAPLCSAVAWYGNLWCPPAVMLWTHPWAARLRRASLVVPLGATMHHKGARPMARKISVHGIDIATCQHEPKFSCSPGSGHCIMPKRPVSDNVMYAVRISGPPKQMLVGYTSGILGAGTQFHRLCPFIVLDCAAYGSMISDMS